MKRVLCTPDLQYPYSEKRAVEALLKYASDNWWDEWVDLGDRIDFDFISKHTKGYPRLQWGKRLHNTYDDAKRELDRWLQAIRNKNPKCKATWIQGNHEYRIDRYVDEHPEVEGLIEVPVQMGLKERNVLWVPYWEKGETYRIGKATFLHGRWINEFHAKKHVLAFMTSVVYGHTHQLQSYSLIKQSKHTPLEGLSLGCLCEEMSYMRGAPTNWDRAFGVFVFEDDGKFQRWVVRIMNGGFRSPEGKFYRG
jgi:hypothetical protein